MSISSQDFVKGIDFTAISPQTAAEHNQLVEQGYPAPDADDTVGRGLLITTTDSAAGVAVVPDPTQSASYTKWKRYLWIRRPFAGSTTKNAQAYSWNDDTANNATYKKWLLVAQDLTQLEADVAQALSDAATALGTSNAANATASQAETDAADAATLANSANNVALTAQTTANNALTTAAQSNALALSAQGTAAAALAAANAPENITNISIGTAAGQKLRSNSANTQLEYFLDQDNYVRLTWSPALTGGQNIINFPAVGSVVAIGGSNYGISTLTIPFDAKTDDTGAICAFNAVTGVITLQPGVYKVKAILHSKAGTTNSNYLIANLMKSADSSVALYGIQSVGDTSLIEGVIIITTAQGPTNFRVDFVAYQKTLGVGTASQITIDEAVITGAPVAFIEFFRMGFK